LSRPTCSHAELYAGSSDGRSFRTEQRNIVTGYLDSAARAMRLASQPDHDTGYDIADEHRDVVYRLWEGSWEDEAVQQDNRVFADPSKIHRVRHFVRHYQVDAIHLAEQRSGHRCCAWRDRPHAAGNSPPCMRTACSLTGRTKTIQGWLSAISDGARRRMDGTLPTSSFFLVEPLWWDALANKQERNTKSIICRRASKALWRSSPVPAGIDLSRYEADEPIRCEKNNVQQGRSNHNAQPRAVDVTPDHRADGAGQPKRADRRICRRGRQRTDLVVEDAGVGGST
jgi:hypothetical protein